MSGQETLPNIWLQFPLPVSNAHYFFPTELIILSFWTGLFFLLLFDMANGNKKRLSQDDIQDLDKSMRSAMLPNSILFQYWRVDAENCNCSQFRQLVVHTKRPHRQLSNVVWWNWRNLGQTLNTHHSWSHFRHWNSLWLWLGQYSKDAYSQLQLINSTTQMEIV